MVKKKEFRRDFLHVKEVKFFLKRQSSNNYNQIKRKTKNITLRLGSCGDVARLFVPFQKVKSVEFAKINSNFGLSALQ